MVEFLENIRHEFETPFHNPVLVFTLILCIILLAPTLLQRVKVPGIIGLIISGIIIGPPGLNLIERNSAVNLFSTIGLLYIMFIAGLELDFKDFIKNKYKSLLFGFMTFAFPLGLGIPACYYLLDYEFNTSLLTASMFATHTLVAYPIASRLGVSKNEAVAITVGGTILTDTAVLIMLAIISGSVESGGNNNLWVRLGISIVIFLLFMVFVVPRISRWFFKRLDSEKNSHFIYVLTIVFLCAFIAELAGLESIIGAFAAGLALNTLIPHTSSLMNRIEFVGNSLFIPFFLISVGMLIDVSVIFEGIDALWVAVVLTVVALLGKWLASHFASKLLKYTRAQRNLIFGLSSAHAAATLAVILVGYNLGIIDENILNGTIILILVTCLVASIITEKAGKKVAIHEKNALPEEANLFNEQKILVPISNPDTMEKLIDFAIAIKKHENHTPIIALSVVQDNDEAQLKLIQNKKMLQQAIVHAAAAEQNVEILATIDQNIANGINRSAREMFASEIVIGLAHKTNLSDLLFGKTIENMIYHTPLMVLACKFIAPINIHRQIKVICPPHCEREVGFTTWLDRVLRLARVLSLDIMFYSKHNTFKFVGNFIARNKISVSAKHQKLSNWDKLSDHLQGTSEIDLIIFVLSRRGSLSYMPIMESLPKKMIKSFRENNLLFIYPRTQESEHFQENLNEYDVNFIERGINQIRMKNKVLPKIFKQDTNEK